MALGIKGIRRAKDVADILFESLLAPQVVPNPISARNAIPYIHNRSIREGIRRQLDAIKKNIPELDSGDANLMTKYVNMAERVPMAAMHRNTPKGLVEMRKSVLLDSVGRKVEAMDVDDTITAKMIENAKANAPAIKEQFEQLHAQDRISQFGESMDDAFNKVRSDPRYQKVIDEDVQSYIAGEADRVKDEMLFVNSIFGNKTNPRIPVKNMMDLEAVNRVLSNVENAVGTKANRVTIGSGEGFRSGGGYRILGSKDINLTSPNPTIFAHELSHVKDTEKPWTDYARMAGDALANATMVATPLSIAYGDKIKEAIPGTVDDKVVDYLAKWGPETFLALKFGTDIVPEHFAHRNSIRVTKQNKLWDDPMFHGIGTPGELEQMARIRSTQNFSSYPIMRLGLPYAAMKGMQFNKESSAYTFHHADPYLDRLKRRFVEGIPAIKKSIVNSIKAIKDPVTTYGSQLYYNPGVPNLLNKDNLGKLLIYGTPIGMYYGIDKLLADEELKRKFGDSLPQSAGKDALEVAMGLKDI